MTAHSDDRPAARSLCFTDEQDRLYERGWPYMRILVDGHKDDRKAVQSAQKFNRYHVHWPREVAHRFVRGAVFSQCNGASWQDPRVRAKLEVAGAINEDEAGMLLDDLLTSRVKAQPHRLSTLLLLLEAMVGTEFVIDSVLPRIECLPRARWLPDRSSFNPGDDEIPGFVAFHLGFMMLRLSRERALEVRQRLERLYERMVDIHGIPHHERCLLGDIDLALHGSRAIARVMPNSRWKFLIWYANVDNLKILKKRMDRIEGRYLADWVPNGRLVYLAGYELLDTYAENLIRVSAPQVPGFLEDIGMFRCETVTRIMLEFVGKKAARDAPLTWFSRHADFARETLEEVAQEQGHLSRAAQAALDSLAL